MLLLTTTASLIQVVTGAAGASVECHASWMDRDSAGTTFSPGSLNPAAITTATTITLVASPSSGTTRNVKHINITNTHASVSTTVAVIHTDGTNATDLMGVTLLPGENLVFAESGDWKHHDAQGGVYSYTAPPSANLGAAGVLAETIPRELCPEVNTTMPASGTLYLQAIRLTAGQLVSNITISTATTAPATPTNQFYALYNANRNLLAKSANQTTAAWAANTPRTLAMTSPYRVPTSGLYYIGYLMVATTIATIKGGTARTGGQLASVAPILSGASSAGLTTTLPNPAAAITANGTSSIYAAVS